MSKSVLHEIDKHLEPLKDNSTDYVRFFIEEKDDKETLLITVDTSEFEEEDEKEFNKHIEFFKNQIGKPNEILLPIYSVDKKDDIFEIRCQVPYPKTVSKYLEENDITELEAKANVSDMVNIYLYILKEKLENRRQMKKEA